MTIKEAQELIEAWTDKAPSHHTSELNSMAMLTEKVGELACVIADRHNQSGQSPEKMHAATNASVDRIAMASALSDAMWALFSIANQSGVDLTEALIDNLNRRNMSKIK